MIPRRPLIVGEAFSPRLSAGAVLAALSRGVLAAGAPEPDMLELGDLDGPGSERTARFAAAGLDERLHRARALVLAVSSLTPQSLLGSVAFELATRARQGGVPSFAVTGENCLGPFDQRILDLQLVFQARSAAKLEASAQHLWLRADSPGTSR